MKKNASSTTPALGFRGLGFSLLLPGRFLLLPRGRCPGLAGGLAIPLARAVLRVFRGPVQKEPLSWLDGGVR
jgi:hypothetical protein